MPELHKRDDGHWVLPVGGASIYRVCRMADTGIVLELGWGDDQDAAIRFSCDFVVRAADGTTHRLSTERLDGLAPILALANGTVRQATFDTNGNLTVVLEDGTVVEAANHPDDESWEVTGPGKILVIAMPGEAEEPAIWS
jgi:hypothetical protein